MDLIIGSSGFCVELVSSNALKYNRLLISYEKGKESENGKITNHLNLTPELLGLADIIIAKVTEARDGSIHIVVGSTKTEMLCRHCKLPTEPYGHGRLLTLRHLPTFGHEALLHNPSTLGAL